MVYIVTGIEIHIEGGFLYSVSFAFNIENLNFKTTIIVSLNAILNAILNITNSVKVIWVPLVKFLWF